MQNLSVFLLQIFIAVFGSFACVRALDNISGIKWKRDVFSVLALDPKALAIYYSARFATVGGAMAYLCGRFVNLGP